MSLIFSALEIGRGDAFLLQDRDSDWNCLVDSGVSKKRIVDILKKKVISIINVAICTHNDIDHAKGFIGLLNSDIKIEEIWLPGNWTSIIQYIKEHENIIHEMNWDLINYAKKTIDEIKSKEQQEKTFVFDTLFDDKKPSIPIEHFNNAISDIEMPDNFDNSIQFLNYIPKALKTSYQRILFSMSRILEIAKLSKQKRCRIRWFSPNCSKNYKTYNHFVALNSEEISEFRVLKDIDAFLSALFLTIENKYSLVFEYLWDKTPILRFSADSDCINQSCHYKNSIIVTAPHHGSESNAVVYSKIQGNDIIWIRSDQKDVHRPCDAFKQIHGNKYCLACRQLNFRSEVCFEFSQGKWIHLKGNECKCK